MTSRERLQCVLSGRIPDCVPACPDIPNMDPARLTGRPFWDIYLYNHPPLMDAYLDAAYHDRDRAHLWPLLHWRAKENR